MEPIPLCTRQILAISGQDCALAASVPASLIGALATSEKSFQRMLEYGLPVGVAHPGPPTPKDKDNPWKEP